MPDTPGGLTENLIACIVALGGDRPASKSLDELYKAFALALVSGGPGGGVQSVVAGTNVTVDSTDPHNPVVSSTGGGGGSAAGFYTPVRLASVGQEVTSTPPSGANDVDGVAVVTGDRILLTQQTVQDDNGIWIANTTDLWARATDMEVGTVILSGSIIPTADDGNENYNAIFILGNSTGRLVTDTPVLASMVVSFPGLSFSPNFRGPTSFPPIPAFNVNAPPEGIAFGSPGFVTADAATTLPADGSQPSVSCLIAAPPYWMDDSGHIIVDGIYLIGAQVSDNAGFTTLHLFMSIGNTSSEIIPIDALTAGLSPSPAAPVSVSVANLPFVAAVQVAMPTDATGTVDVTPFVWKLQ